MPRLMRGRVGIILLAAGGSRRLGRPKQLLHDARGESLLRRAARTAAASDCHSVVVVLGGAAVESAQELDGLPLKIIVNPDWQTGMASSLKAGLSALTADAELEAVIVMLCDQPMVTSSLLYSLIETHYASGHDLIACEYGGIVGVPALFGRVLFEALASLEGDEGARRVIKAYQGPMSRLAFLEGDIDVDTSEGLETFLDHEARQRHLQQLS